MIDSGITLPRGEGWVRIQAPSRLHFGLLALPHVAHPTLWPDAAGQMTITQRHFGGCGLMIRDPGLELALRPATEWSAIGPQAERVLDLAKFLGGQFGTWKQRASQPCEIIVRRAAPAHAGLGSGTQLSLAIARALRQVYGLRKLGPGELARLVDRGQRSAVGVHGFVHGGFLVEAGHGSSLRLGRLIARPKFPATWHVVVAIPRGESGLHGNRESHAFVKLRHRLSDLAHTDAMCRLLLLGVLPALEEKDLAVFGEALHDYNRRAGEMFRSVQGGPYAHPQTAAIVEFLLHEGIRGVGQSSWGPATFAVVEEDRAAWARQALCNRFGLQDDEVLLTQADNEGAKAFAA